MRGILYFALGLAAFVCAWLTLYQLGRVVIAVAPAARVAVLVIVTIASVAVAWTVMRDFRR